MALKDRKGIEKLVNGAMAFLAFDNESLSRVFQNRDLNIDWDLLKWPLDVVYPIVRSILNEYRRITPVISFNHQIYVPAVEGARFGNYDVVIVDESQDQSPAKMRLCELALHPDGVMVAVGDPAQAIFGFAGADGRSTQNYIEKWQPKVLPLSITYRCPKLIVESVKHVVPDYAAHESAADGEIIESNIDQMYAVWKAGDVCISATNAPTVKHCLAAWRQGKKAMVLGRDFAEELKKLLRKSETDSVVTFLGWLATYVEEETTRLLASKRNEAIEKLEDIAETLMELCNGLNTIEQVKTRMDQVFAEDPKEGCILLTSTHKYKGGEAAVIFMFSDTYKPTGQSYESDEVVAPADCLWYVARTRVMAVAGDPDSGKLYLVPVKGSNGKKAAVPGDIEADAVEELPPLKIAPAVIVRDVPQLEAPTPPARVSRKLPAVVVTAPVAPVTSKRQRVAPLSWEEQQELARKMFGL